MSMLHRVSSAESVQRSAEHSPGPEGRLRKLSFSPVANDEAVSKSEPVAAFDVPRWKRLLQVAAAVVYCVLSAGIVFGYAALKQVLIGEGVYRDRCTKQELDAGVAVCRQQELSLNLMFTVAAVSTNVGALPIGAILDKFGPRITSMIGSVLIAVGCLFLGFAAQASFDAWIPGYFFLAFGGPFIFIPTFHLSNAFPRYSGLILALVTGAFDTSSAIFLLYRLGYEGSGGSVRPKTFFLSYLVVPVLIFVVQAVLMPKESYKSVGELIKTAAEDDAQDAVAHPERDMIQPERGRRSSAVSEITSLLGTKDADAHVKQEEKKQVNSGVWGVLHGKTALQQIKTPWFVLIALYAMVQMLRINFFVATIRPQYEYLLDSHSKAKQVNDVFDVALPLGGIVAVPFIGILLDNVSTTLVLSIMVAVSTVIGILNIMPFIGAAYAHIILFTLFRPFYYTAVSDYSAKVFGFQTFGKVYGLVICLSGIFNFAQYGLDSLTQNTFKKNPIPVNSLLVGVGLILGVAFVGYCAIRSKHIRREQLEEEAESSRPLLMPGADERVLEDRHPIDVHGSTDQR